jgi:hypothetical protein
LSGSSLTQPYLHLLLQSQPAHTLTSYAVLLFVQGL